MPDAPPPPPRGTLAGVTPGVLVVAGLLFALQCAGLGAPAAYAVAAPAGVATTVVLCRRHTGAEAAVGLAVVLTLSFSLLAGVLVAFALAIVGVD